jgi:hypothetical protein
LRLEDLVFLVCIVTEFFGARTELADVKELDRLDVIGDEADENASVEPPAARQHINMVNTSEYRLRMVAQRNSVYKEDAVMRKATILVEDGVVVRRRSVV